MTHTAKNFDHLIGQLKGISEKQLRNHFELYQGYVKKINEIDEKLKGADRSASNYSFAEYSELQRRRAVAYNGAYLHQLYFENLSGSESKPSAELAAAIDKTFGSLESWANDALAGMKSGHGWVLLCRSRLNGSLCNNVLEEHHRGLLIEQDILLALDGWEHAYMIDYGVKKAEYFKALQAVIDWKVASQRFQAASRLLRSAA